MFPCVADAFVRGGSRNGGAARRGRPRRPSRRSPSVSTASAFVLHGARPVFGDERPDTLNLHESNVEATITEKTRVIAPTL